MQIEITVPRKLRPWFQARRVLPVVAQVDTEKRTVTYAGITFSCRDVGGGFVAVTKPGMDMPLGEFSAEDVRHTLSETAAKDVRVVRAALLSKPYEVATAVEFEDGTMAHPSCAGDEEPVRLYRRVRDEDARCRACGEAFE